MDQNIFLLKHPLTDHAEMRMRQRYISPELLELVLTYGRTIYCKGTTYKVIGRKEVEIWASKAINLHAAERVHVFLGGDGAVVTTYRNQNLRKIRPSKRRQSFCH